MRSWGDRRQNTATSFRCHEHRQCHLDEFLVAVDGDQGAAQIVGDLGCAAGLDSVGKLQDGGLKGELIFVDLEKQGREQV
jgi:hypothetical protein